MDDSERAAQSRLDGARLPIAGLVLTAAAGAALAALILLVAGPADAHGGGLNAEGCHNDRRNGGYHCHRSAGAPRTSAYAPRGLMSQARAYANCSAARAAGAAPVRRGDPGYGPHLDRDGDGDGVGCE